MSEERISHRCAVICSHFSWKRFESRTNKKWIYFPKNKRGVSKKKKLKWRCHSEVIQLVSDSILRWPSPRTGATCFSEGSSSVLAANASTAPVWRMWEDNLASGLDSEGDGKSCTANILSGSWCWSCDTRLPRSLLDNTLEDNVFSVSQSMFYHRTEDLKRKLLATEIKNDPFCIWWSYSS